MSILAQQWLFDLGAFAWMIALGYWMWGLRRWKAALCDTQATAEKWAEALDKREQEVRRREWLLLHIERGQL